MPLNNRDDIDPETSEFLMDLLLLSVIRGNPLVHSLATNDLKRLRNVKRDLFGIRPSKGRPTDGDLPELLFMAREYIRDRGDPDYGEDYSLTWKVLNRSNARSITQLADCALTERQRQNPALKLHNREEKTRNLQQKFEARLPDLLKVVFGRDGLADSVFWGHLTEVSGLLKSLGISVAEPVDPQRDAKAPT